MNITDKTIVITGASEGIGRAIALRLAEEKCNLALLARNQQKLQEVKKLSLEKGAQQVNTYSCDIRNTKHLQQTIQSITEDFDTVDILINNAGIRQKLMQVDEIASDNIDDIISTNLTALIHTTRLLLPTLRGQEQAAIINISSKSGVTAQQGQSVYTATKHGVRGFTEVLKNDLKETNIRVAGVYQSGTNTAMFAKTGEEFPIKTFSKPEDLADIIAYMLTRPPKIRLHEVRIDK